MFGRKSSASQDETTKQLQASGVYSMGKAPHPYIVDNETVEAVKEKKIYSFWAAVWYTSILSLLLFWFPPFGQMIAGYVGGRKAGVPWKGAIAAFAPMSLIFLLFFLRAMGSHVSEIDWFLGLPAQGADFVSENLPVFGPVLAFMSDYLHKFAEALWSAEFFVYPYVLTVVFGYIGGIMSLQHRREMESDGKDHPFFPVTLPDLHMHMPQPEVAAAASPAAPEQPEVVTGKVPKGWKMRKDKKKGKW
jgi:hypothetical protein